MQATILREIQLPNLPSASGVEVVGEMVYIIGDDAPLLYCFDARELTAGQPVTLFETAHFSAGRIPKGLKPDLECLTAVPAPDGGTALLALGSGATAAREVGYWVTLSGPAPATASVYPLSLTPLYQLLRAKLPAGLTLNLEAAASTADSLLLMQRSVGMATGNLVFHCPLASTLDFIRHRTVRAPAIGVQEYALPHIDGKPAGLSGAVGFEGQLFVTASVEDTTDPVADGAVLGSFVGVLDAQPRSARPLPVALARLQRPDGQPYRGKVEGVAVRRRLGPGRYELLLVTDDDAGGSTAVEVELRV
ncbi:hypothetical protein LJ737_13255 [Hymenobacter sp. 15J16-1T3B]|uniref:DUF6929 family protein n=1 Tax=Hymenobacter sp. 15J16-1T3B TaxID=2886941 RepID=UPI001D1124DA|nr:hypothetical protein [Hymenobacter sp. 15J16-1T3B]MCC3158209.1 hypothetical protein [Hymenobacter sp. 15J16-1T3B]